MDAKRDRRLLEILDQIVDLPEAQRARFLDQACKDDETLRREAEACLAGESGAVPRPLARAPREVAPNRIGPYAVECELGRGGMGVVYRAIRMDGAYQKRVAVKVVKSGLDAEPFIRRFLRERQILANLDHPHIAQLLDGGADDAGRPYFVMEWVEGQPIDAFCDRRRLGVRARLALFAKVCAAVQFAHQNLIVHRDIKPGNILVTEDGEPKLLDFGVAKLLQPDAAEPQTATFWRAMTPEWASPEQIRGLPPTAATDVYALGLLLCKLTAGQLPYAAPSADLDDLTAVICRHEPTRPSAVVAALKSAPAASPQAERLDRLCQARGADPKSLSRQLRGDVDSIVLKALRKRPQDRYGSAERLAADVTRFLEGRPVLARGGAFRYRAGKFYRRHRLRLLVAASLLAAAVALPVSFGLAKRIEQRETERALRRAELISEFLVDLFENADPYAEQVQMDTQQLVAKAADQIGQQRVQDPTLRAALLTTLGRVSHNIGQNQTARALLDEAMTLHAETAGRRSPAYADAAYYLARLCYEEGELGESQALLNRVLAIRERDLSNEPAAVAHAHNGLALVHTAAGRFEQAEAAATRALDLAETAAERDPQLLAQIHDNLGGARQASGRFHEAEPNLREAVRLYREGYGDSHPLLANGLNNLAVTLQSLAKHEEAEQTLIQAQALFTRTFDADHPTVADTLNNLGSLYLDLRRYADAQLLLERAERIMSRAHGPDHIRIAAILDNLAKACHSLDELDRAETLYRRTLAIRRQTLGPRHPRVAVALNNLAALCQKRGQYDLAVDLHREVLDIIEQTLGLDHPNAAASFYHLGSIDLERGSLADAETHLQRALTIVENSLGPDHPLAAHALLKLAALFRDQDRIEQALASSERALRIREAAFPTDNPQVQAARAFHQTLLDHQAPPQSPAKDNP